MLQAYRGKILHCLSYDYEKNKTHYEYFDDGLLIVENGLVKAVGEAQRLLKDYENIPVNHHPDKFIMPGFVDTHTHYPQLDVIASYGEQLLSWLEEYVFPEEMKYSDRDYAKTKAEVFLKSLLANGTTSALIFSTVYSASVEALFEVAQEYNMRIISGKVLSDRHLPKELQDTPQQSYEESKQLIEKWHGVGRLHYAVMPRFAITSSSEQLAVAKRLLTEYPHVYFHTHLAENLEECQWVQELFPESRSYLDVYDSFDLLSKQSIFAHGVHLDRQDLQRLCATQSAVAFCPTSNLFLGSGLFPFKEAMEEQVTVGLGTDVGAGTSLSFFHTVNEAYKVCQLEKGKLCPLHAFYLATLGGAKALNIDDKIGNFETGKEADFIILDAKGNHALQQRLLHTKTLDETLFALFMLGDERLIHETYVMGKCA